MTIKTIEIVESEIRGKLENQSEILVKHTIEPQQNSKTEHHVSYLHQQHLEKLNLSISILTCHSDSEITISKSQLAN